MWHLHDVTFEVPDNHFCAILGHSGCGKTTLLNIAAGFEQPTTGAVMVDDDANPRAGLAEYNDLPGLRAVPLDERLTRTSCSAWK